MMLHVVIIDAGSRGTSTGASEHGYRKAEVNKCIANLWTSVAQEIKAPYEAVRDLWCRDENGWQYSSLAMAMRALDAKWAEAPILTVREMTTEDVDADEQVL